MEDIPDDIEQHELVKSCKQVANQFGEQLSQAAERGDMRAIALLTEGAKKAFWNVMLARGYLLYMKERQSLDDLLGDLKIDLEE